MTNLTLAEGALIIDALNGIGETNGIARKSHLLANVREAINMDNLDKKHGCDRVKLVNKLSNVSEDEAGELLDKVKAFWKGQNYVPDTAKRLREVGLVNEYVSQELVGEILEAIVE